MKGVLNMKRFILTILILSFLCMLVACNSNAKDVSKDDGRDILNPYFTGKVIEIYEKGCLLEVTDIGNGHFTIGDKVQVNTNISTCPEYYVGDFLRISFDGKIAESYPPQINKVFIVSKMDGGETTLNN